MASPFGTHPQLSAFGVVKVKKSLSKIASEIQNRDTPNDVFITPLPLAKIQIDMIKAEPQEVWMDPFKNDGSYFNQFPQHEGVEHEWTEILYGRDFFTYRGEVDIICSNPPFSLINKCLEKFVELKPRVISILIGTMNVTPSRFERMEKAGYTLTEYRLCAWAPIVGMACVIQWERTNLLTTPNIKTYIGRF